MARSIMVIGTASNVGKSIVATALCRILAQDGYRVAPFKAQNMSLNSAVTPSFREIGRAQAAQAEACGILPNEHMNPVLLKPTGDMRSQIVLQGRPIGTRAARDYFYDDKKLLWQAVVESYQYLASRYDVLVIEGAGSPVEMNLKQRDIANMRTAELADARVIIVADIDRGGVFASIVGTLQLLEANERDRVGGIIINKFRGDPRLFEEGRAWLERYTGIPVLGVLPYIPDIGIDEEDSVGLESPRYRRSRQDGPAAQVAIIQLPHMSNFTDSDPLFLEPDIHPYFCTKVEELVNADAVVIPGTKSTLHDLQWLHETGLANGIRECLHRGAPVIGICGGYQMLGIEVRDEEHHESDKDACEGLGIFDCVTTIGSEKTTVLVRGILEGAFQDIEVEGYEIHMGQSKFRGNRHPLARTRVQDSAPWSMEGCTSEDGRVIGTYLHGILHNDAFRSAWLNRLRQGRGLPARQTSLNMEKLRTAAYNRLADTVRAELNMDLVHTMLK